ncbi:M23 family metallopeptidase [Thalassospira lucentensis]|uniref:M23 family metallopeptidase n=1 Tax=Thalassospira lucentensis TaxID=168935 RepID=UPI0003B4D1E2|nr:M23 family metallopeptidase [Thalassospira lucentensis]
MMENCVTQAVQRGKSLLLVCMTTAALSGCLLNSVPVPVVYGDGASYSPYSMPELKNGERVVTVEPGDTVSQIAARYSTDFRRFTSRNDLREPYVIYPGQRLVLPPWQSDYNSMPPTAVASSTPSAPTKTVTIGGKRQVVNVPTKSTPPSSTPSRPETVVARVAPTGGGSIPTPGIKPRDYAAAAEQEFATTRSWQSDRQSTPEAGQGSNVRKDVVLAEPTGRKGFIWPVQGKVVLKYGAGNGGLFNDGINIQANRGTPITAAENGVVTYVGNELRGFGNLILIKHADNYVTAYAHTENPMVARGDVVTRGQHISSVGSTGAVTFPQLHFEIRRGRKSSDPMKFLPSVMVSR